MVIVSVVILVCIDGVMMVRVEISGVNAVTKMLKKFTDKSIYCDTVRSTAELAEEYSHMYAPELTGYMEGSIGVKPSGDCSFILFCDVPYAVYNEYGSYYMHVGTVDNPKPVVSGSGKLAFRPFLRPAAYRSVHEVGKIFSHYLKYKSWK